MVFLWHPWNLFIYERRSPDDDGFPLISGPPNFWLCGPVNKTRNFLLCVNRVTTSIVLLMPYCSTECWSRVRAVCVQITFFIRLLLHWRLRAGRSKRRQQYRFVQITGVAVGVLNEPFLLFSGQWLWFSCSMNVWFCRVCHYHPFSLYQQTNSSSTRWICFV